MSYFGNIKRGIKTTVKGMSLTLKHLADARFSRSDRQIENDDFFGLEKGHVTIQYPHQTINVPDNGRYQLDCEIDDCIVCDKCAKVCPVDCIEIEAIKSPELIRYTSDGSPVRLYAAKFDIDMAKCCFCGLCTTVCPTECLTMNSEYDYSVLDVTQLNFAFANLSAEQAQEKRDLYEQFVAEKEAAKSKPKLEENNLEEKPVAKPVFLPGMKPVIQEKTESDSKPVFRPGMKPATPAAQKSDEIIPNKPKPVFKPSIKPATSNLPMGDEAASVPAFKPQMKPKTEVKNTPESEESVEKPKPAFRPQMKPKTDSTTPSEIENSDSKPKPVFRPQMKPKAEVGDKSQASDSEAKPKPVFKPQMKPVAKATNTDGELVEKPKPVFRPTLKPKTDE